MEGKEYKLMTVTSPTPGKDGKTYWPKVGVGWQKGEGISIKLDSMPLNGKLYVSEWTPYNRDRQQQREMPAVASMPPVVEPPISHGDDLPF